MVKPKRLAIVDKWPRRERPKEDARQLEKRFAAAVREHRDLQRQLREAQQSARIDELTALNFKLQQQLTVAERKYKTTREFN
jgi:hypothetical protein